MKPYKILIIFLICCLPVFVVAQEAGGSGEKTEKPGNAEKAEKKAAQLKAKHDQEALIGYQKSVKHQHKIQTKAVRKRMKKSLRESRREKPGHKDFFLKRWFTKKKR
jgi:hypothetical protein